MAGRHGRPSAPDHPGLLRPGGTPSALNSSGDPEPGTDARFEARVRATYDLIAAAYDEHIGGELEHKVLDRAALCAFAELASSGTIADVGCGPGHVTRFLTARHGAVVGIDLSPEMVHTARRHDPHGRYVVGTMLALPVSDAAWSGAVLLYSIIHLTSNGRRAALREVARAIGTGGWLLVAFHVESDEFPPGSTNRLSEWFGYPVDIDAHFLEPDDVTADVSSAGFDVVARTVRSPSQGEYPSRRCTLLATRSASAHGETPDSP